eukprot:scaffold24879_cov17-Tisochrysis_lutea.AAC.1
MPMIQNSSGKGNLHRNTPPIWWEMRVLYRCLSEPHKMAMLTLPVYALLPPLSNILLRQLICSQIQTTKGEAGPTHGTL